jgi:uncharacterized membrane protein YgcG
MVLVVLVVLVVVLLVVLVVLVVFVVLVVLVMLIVALVLVVLVVLAMLVVVRDGPLHLLFQFRMLKGFNMELEHSQNFYDFFNDHRSYTDDMDLMYKMQAMDRKTGTMSTDEWEAIGLYKVFVFRKQHDRPYGPPSWDSAGGGMYRNASHRSRGGGYGRGGYSASEPHTHKRHKPHY